MKKTIQLPLIGSYGFSNQQAFRYTFTAEGENRLERYKEEIIKCLKYDFLYSILPNYTLGDKVLDWLIPARVKSVEIDNQKYGCIFNESIQGGKGGEVVAVYSLSEDGESLNLTLYDRNATVQNYPSFVDGKTSSSEYFLVDGIIESDIKIVKGKKITPDNIEVYLNEKLYGDKKHSYNSAMEVINSIKTKSNHEEFVDFAIDEEKKKTRK